MNDLKKQTSDELDRLSRCEEIITRGKRTFLEVGNALLEIRDGKFWKHAEVSPGEAGYANFDDYCQRRHGFTKNYANRLIAGIKVAEVMPIGTDLNEAQARELGKVPKENRQEVYDWAKEKAGDKPVTAKVIREAIDDFEEAEPEEETDDDDSCLEAEAEEPEEDTEDEEQEPETQGDWLTDAVEELAFACGNKLLLADFLDGLAGIFDGMDKSVLVAKLENMATRLRAGL